ncbi:hypothetical protein Tco_0945748, partial [Tanacetum coccineum]
THVLDLCALEQLDRYAYQEAEKQQIFAQKVKKNRVQVLENINGDNNCLNEFLKADKRAKHFSQQAQSQFVSDLDIIRDLEKQRDKLDLDVKDYKWKNEELQKTHLILKRQMSENEDSYHDTVLDLEAKLQKNVDLILKLGNSLQGMFMLGPKPLSVYDHLGNSEISLNVRDTKDTLDDASKNFVLQKELSAEQKYFPSSFIPSDKNSNATPSILVSMPSIIATNFLRLKLNLSKNGKLLKEYRNLVEAAIVINLPVALFISQSQYAFEILKDIGLLDECVSMRTHMATERLDANLQGTPTDQTTYRRIIGGLMYLTASRPDIAFATFVCARYQARPTVKHLKEFKRIFRYLRQS